MHGKVHTANKYPAPDESPKRVLHKPCGAGLSVPAIKTDGAYDQETIEISTSKVI